jgi:hypothetical protein
LVFLLEWLQEAARPSLVPAGGITGNCAAGCGCTLGALLRIGTLIAVDGLVPLEPDFLQKCVDATSQPRSARLSQNAFYQKIPAAFSGRSDADRLGAVSETLDSAEGSVGWIREALAAERFADGGPKTMTPLGQRGTCRLAKPMAPLRE